MSCTHEIVSTTFQRSINIFGRSKFGTLKVSREHAICFQKSTHSNHQCPIAITNETKQARIVAMSLKLHIFPIKIAKYAPGKKCRSITPHLSTSKQVITIGTHKEERLSSIQNMNVISQYQPCFPRSHRTIKTNQICLEQLEVKRKNDTS